jgi:hypothetical protein
LLMLNAVSTPLRNKKESVYTMEARNMVVQRSLETCRRKGRSILVRDLFLSEPG